MTPQVNKNSHHNIVLHQEEYYEDNYFDDDYLNEEDYEYIDQPKLPVTIINTIPFWFGYEDVDHLRLICAKLYDFLKLKSSKFKFFIGRMNRQPVMNESDLFTTYDIVDIYKKDPNCPLGGSMCYVSTSELLITWDNDTGLPLRICDISQSRNMQDFWSDKVVKQLQCFIHCMPSWLFRNECKYFSSKNDKVVGYSDEPFHFARYFDDFYTTEKSDDMDYEELLYI
eukprot:TRINITY_DN8915_c0_g1_i1.p1 TRINITY_DN8915_c0_g1~~TRINITY_DN8915_c0_g1_i1.p1  ORF type:complete len:226 (-),score=40.08 TRINITY_DN8915_c0_g1_i1:570-1247(-)